MKNLQIEFINKQDESMLSLALSGNLTAVRAIEFKNDLIEMIKTQKTDCAIDISDLAALDIAGVNALALAHKTTQNFGKQLTILSNHKNPADEFLHLTKFNKVFNLVRS